MFTDIRHYPNRHPHKDAHAKLLETVIKKHKEIESNQNIDIAEISKFLRSWLLDHVVKENMQIKPYLMGGRVE